MMLRRRMDGEEVFVGGEADERLKAVDCYGGMSLDLQAGSTIFSMVASSGGLAGGNRGVAIVVSHFADQAAR